MQGPSPNRFPKSHCRGLLRHLSLRPVACQELVQITSGRCTASVGRFLGCISLGIELHTSLNTTLKSLHDSKVCQSDGNTNVEISVKRISTLQEMCSVVFLFGRLRIHTVSRESMHGVYTFIPSF